MLSYSTLSAVNNTPPEPLGHNPDFEGADKLPAHVVRKGPHRPPPLWEEVQLKRSTYQASSRAEYWLGRIEEAANRLSNRRSLVRATQLREASAALNDENVFLAFPEIMAMDLPEVTVRRPVDPRVLRFQRADDDAVERIVQGEHVGHVLFGRTARILSSLPLAAEHGAEPDGDVLERIPWRQSPAWLGGPRPEDAFLLCTPHGPELRAVIAELMTWLGAETDLPVVVRQALAHHQVATASPVPHSEHLSRLLIVLGFIQAGALRDQIVAPSLWFTPRNEEYRRQFTRLVDTGDFDTWVTFFADGVTELCESQIELIHVLEQVRDKQLVTFKRNDGLTRLMDALVGNPVFNTELAARLSGLSERQVQTLVKRLEGKHFVRKWDRNRQVRKKGQQTVREVPEVVKAIGMLDRIPFRRDSTVFDTDPPPPDTTRE